MVSKLDIKILRRNQRAYGVYQTMTDNRGRMIMANSEGVYAIRYTEPLTLMRRLIGNPKWNTTLHRKLLANAISFQRTGEERFV